MINKNIKRNISIDMGSSSVKMQLNEFNGKNIKTKVFYQFKTHKINIKDNYFWDYKRILNDIILGLKKLNVNIDSIGIDGWGVDYALLSNSNNILDRVYTYRDNSGKVAWKTFPKEELFKITGILDNVINTSNQIHRDNIIRPKIIENAKNILLIADLFNFLLTGVVVNESTLASTTQMIIQGEKNINNRIKEILKIKNVDFKIIKEGFNLGKISYNLKKNLNIGDPSIIVVPGHDTACAIATLPLKKNDMFISTGSWTVIGIILDKAIINKRIQKIGLSNEQAAFNKIKLLKNINGLFLIQQLKKYWNLSNEYVDFSDISKSAKYENFFKSNFNPNDPNFIEDNNIILKINEHCKKTKQKIPNNLGQYAQTIYNSLIKEYKIIIKDIQNIIKNKIKKICICGGGLKDSYFIEKIKDEIGIKIYEGPIEASSLGNSLLQFYYSKVINKNTLYKLAKQTSKNKEK